MKNRRMLRSGCALLSVVATLTAFYPLPVHAQTLCGAYWYLWAGGGGPYPTQQAACIAYNNTSTTPLGLGTITETNAFSPGAQWGTPDASGNYPDHYCTDTETVSSNPQNCQAIAAGEDPFPTCGTHVLPEAESVLEQIYNYGCGNLAPSMIDPVPAGEVNAQGVIADANGLSTSSNTVVGIAADGAAEIVVRVAAPSAGTAMQLSLTDENGTPAPAGSANALGYLTTLLPSDGTASTAGGQPITVTTVSVASGAMAFAVYHAPKDFVRDGNTNDTNAGIRNVLVQGAVGGAQLLQAQIDILRPPVVFIHGIWGSGDDGDEILSSLMADGTGLTTYSIDYDAPVTVASSDPSYGSNLTVGGSSLGFDFGASTVLPELYDAIADYRTNNSSGQPIAVARADIVAHSMGGDVARYLPLIGGFTSTANYELGPIHKLITIGTPHLGSPLAADLMNGSNSCVTWVLKKDQRYAFTSAVLSSGQYYEGGIGDLEPLSAALANIQPATTTITTTIPTAMIAASMSSAQLAAVDTSRNAKAIRAFCGDLFNNPLAKALTSTGWPTVLGGDSDAIVPLNSQTAGPSNQPAFPPGAEVHSPGTEDLGFGGPSELDDTAVVPPEVLQLLNTPVDQSAFVPLP